jgi:hypothetical protein
VAALAENREFAGVLERGAGLKTGTELVKAVFGILPREFLFENVVAELDDVELNAMIEAFREQQRLAALEQPQKMIEHERTH